MLLGLHGKAGSGKDAAYSFIQEWAESDPEYPVARRDAFADRLKISAARALGWDDPSLLMGADEIDFCNRLKCDGAAVTVDLPGFKSVLSISGREYLQNYGTEAHREVFNYDFWVDAVLPRDYNHHGEILVITDVRFENEAQRVRDLGGQVWHIYRPEAESKDAHASEQPLPISMIHHTIQNTKSLDHFRDLVLSKMERYVYA